MEHTKNALRFTSISSASMTKEKFLNSLLVQGVIIIPLSNEMSVIMHRTLPYSVYINFVGNNNQVKLINDIHPRTAFALRFHQDGNIRIEDEDGFIIRVTADKFLQTIESICRGDFEE